MLPAEKPWEKIAHTPEALQVLYREWGFFFATRNEMNMATNYYDKALNLRDDDPKALYSRSVCKRNIAQTSEALKDAKAAAVYDPNNQTSNVAVGDTLYELNRFEEATADLFDKSRKFKGRRVKPFLDRITVLEENFKDAVGESWATFVLCNEKAIAKVMEQLEQGKHIDPRPMWKILKALDKCDTLSVLEKEEILLPPLEKARRNRAFNVLNQIYFNKSAEDFKFIKKLRRDPNLLIQQSKESTPILRNLLDNKCTAFKNFLKMLHARSPLYVEQARRCPNRKMWELHREAHLFGIQYQTRRDMLETLHTLRKLRATGEVEKLSKQVEEFMGKHVVLKTYRVMPWKFEFMNEVYNTLALAYCDQFTEPTNLSEVRLRKDALIVVLRVPRDKARDPTGFVFGNQSTFQEPDAPDHALIAYKKHLARMERRMRFVKYSIEKCYLLHEIARSHLAQSRFDECYSVAHKGVDETKNCKNIVWRFLCTMMAVKAHAVLHKIERCRDELNEAKLIAAELRSSRLLSFVELCLSLNDMELLMKQRHQSSASVRMVSRRKFGQGSSSSIHSSKIKRSRKLTDSEDMEWESELEADIEEDY